MASHRAHVRTGWAAAWLTAALLVDSGLSLWWRLAAAVAARYGATAPDWLEWAWWWRRRRGQRWIAHRSWTHWGLGWLGLLGGSQVLLASSPEAGLLFGFALGGCVHLLADWPNPLGVPWLWRRHTLGWWKSGQCDWLVVTLAWLVAGGVGYRVWGAAGWRMLRMVLAG